MTDRAKRALITGITGQDGSYLAELLLGKGYEVTASSAAPARFNGRASTTSIRIRTTSDAGLLLHYGDLSDSSSLHQHAATSSSPMRSTTSGAQSHVKVSFDIPEYTADITGVGTLRLLEAIRETDWPSASTRPSSARCSARSRKSRRRETTPFYPRSPYAVAKVFAYWVTVNYREAYGMFACNGILFNHESPRRGETFVTRKITRAVARIVLGTAGEALSRQSGRAARLGLRPGIRRGDVADAAAGPARTIS